MRLEEILGDGGGDCVTGELEVVHIDTDFTGGLLCCERGDNPAIGVDNFPFDGQPPSPVSTEELESGCDLRDSQIQSKGGIASGEHRD